MRFGPIPAHRGAGGDRARRCDERVRAVVEIEQRPLRTFEEHPLTRTERAIDEQGRIGDVQASRSAKRSCIETTSSTSNGFSSYTR